MKGNKMASGKVSFARQGVHCRVCHHWIPVGERKATQKICTMSNSWAVPSESYYWVKGKKVQKSKCQEIWGKYRGGNPSKSREYTCRVCEEIKPAIRAGQIVCLSREKGVKTPCQIKWEKTTCSSDDSQAVKEFQAGYQPKNEKKKRNCLRCGTKFKSLSFANRICDKCNSANDRGAVKTCRVGTTGHGSMATRDRNIIAAT
jgi:hypothetical protein